MIARLLAAICVAALAGGVDAATYYVATDGSDSAAGTEAAPWKTIDKAINTASDGDLVLVRAGEYTIGRPTKNRTTDYLTIRPAPGAAGQVTITNYFRPYVNADYLRLENLNFTTGLYCEPVKHFQVRGCTFGGHPTLTTCLVSGQDILIEGCEVKGGDHAIAAMGTDVICRWNEIHHTSSDAIRAGGTNLVYEGNYFHDNNPTEGAHPDHIQFYNGDPTFARNVTIRGNYFDTNGQGLFSRVYTLEGHVFENIVVENNVIFSSHLRCYSLATTNNVTVRNNLFCYLPEQADPMGGAALLYMYNWGGGPYLYANNISRTLSVPTSSHLTLKNNLTIEQAATGTGGIGKVAPTALFVNFPGHNYMIRSTSPTIGAADPATATALDFLGRQRDDDPDIGPYEYRAEDAGKTLLELFLVRFRAKQAEIRGQLGPQVALWQVPSSHGAAEFVRAADGDGLVVPQLAGLKVLRVGFSTPIDPATAVAGAVTVHDGGGTELSGQIGGLSVSADGLTLTVTFAAALADRGRYTIALTDQLRSASGQVLEGDRDLVVRTLAGDVDGSGQVTADDVTAVREGAAREVTAASSVLDVDGSGQISAADLQAVRGRLGNSAP